MTHVWHAVLSAELRFFSGIVWILVLLGCGGLKWQVYSIL